MIVSSGFLGVFLLFQNAVISSFGTIFFFFFFFFLTAWCHTRLFNVLFEKKTCQLFIKSDGEEKKIPRLYSRASYNIFNC